MSKVEKATIVEMGDGIVCFNDKGDSVGFHPTSEGMTLRLMSPQLHAVMADIPVDHDRLIKVHALITHALERTGPRPGDAAAPVSTRTISVADFSQFPAGRYRSDGPRSGEAFREDVLLPALRKGPVRVLLDGTMGYGCSFLEEAFGGLVRERGFSRQGIDQRIFIEASDGSLIKEVWRYVLGTDHERAKAHE